MDSPQVSLFPATMKAGDRVRIKGGGSGAIAWLGPEWLPDQIVKVQLDSGEVWSGHARDLEPGF